MLLVMLILMAVLFVILRPWPFFSKRQHSRTLNERSIAKEFGNWVEHRAKAHGVNARGVARPIPLECPRCGKSSNYFVYPDELCERCWRSNLRQISAPAEQTGK